MSSFTLENIILENNTIEIVEENVKSGNNKTLVEILKNKLLNTKKRGIYIFYKNNIDLNNIVYIGKAGTFDNENVVKQFKGQTLFGRLKNIRGKIKAAEYFKQRFEDKSITKIVIAYHYTNDSELPGYAEACLLQDYFSRYKELPEWNKAY